MNKKLERDIRARIIKEKHHRIDSLAIGERVPGDRPGMKACSSYIVSRVEDGTIPNLHSIYLYEISYHCIS